MKKIEGVNDPVPGEPTEPVVSGPVSTEGFAGIPKQTIFIVGGLVAVIGIATLVFFLQK